MPDLIFSLRVFKIRRLPQIPFITLPVLRFLGQRFTHTDDGRRRGNHLSVRVAINSHNSNAPTNNNVDYVRCSHSQLEMNIFEKGNAISGT